MLALEIRSLRPSFQGNDRPQKQEMQIGIRFLTQSSNESSRWDSEAFISRCAARHRFLTCLKEKGSFVKKVL